MSSRYYKEGCQALEKGTVKLWGRFVVGASGAIASQDCKGFSVALNASPGTYIATLEDTFMGLLMFHANVIDAVAAGEGKFAQITAEAVATKAAKTIGFTMIATDDGLAADVASGGIVLIEITLKNSTVAY